MTRRSGRFPLCLAVFVIAYTVLGAGAAMVRDDAMTGSTEDTALFDHLLWSTLHGRFAPNLTFGVCQFGVRCSFFVLVLLPFYWLAQDPDTLFVLQSLAIGLCAVPSFLLARRWLAHEGAAFLVAVAVVAHPAVLSQNVNQVHEAQFALPVLVWAALLFERERFGPFLVACAVACLGKENLAAAVFMFGPVAAIQRRKWRWILAPSVLATTILGGFTLFVAPALNPGGERAWHHFLPDGQAHGQGLAALATQADEFVRRALQPGRLAYLGKCILSAGAVLPLLGPLSILALPELLVNMTVASGSFTVLHYHFSLTVGVFLVLGAAQGIGRLCTWFGGRNLALCRLGLSGLLAALAVAGNLFWLDLRPFRKPARHSTQLAALALVPEDPNLSVLAPHGMLSKLSRRHQLYYLDRRSLHGKDLTAIHVIILDLNGVVAGANRHVAGLMRDGPGARSHRAVFEKDGMLVFFRRDIPLSAATS
ncbi:MAG: DUF2079 domain-containing protein [Planctomycetes bacterium]|nr:DUF2079 domain-containing protein [Planctomycetota bacterium]